MARLNNHRVYIYIIIWLVELGGLEHEFYDVPYIGNIIIPTDELIFFRGVGIPPTRQSFSICENDGDGDVMIMMMVLMVMFFRYTTNQ